MGLNFQNIWTIRSQVIQVFQKSVAINSRVLKQAIDHSNESEQEVSYSGARLQQTPRERRILSTKEEIYYNRDRKVKKERQRELNLTLLQPNIYYSRARLQLHRLQQIFSYSRVKLSSLRLYFFTIPSPSAYGLKNSRGGPFENQVRRDLPGI